MNSYFLILVFLLLILQVDGVARRLPTCEEDPENPDCTEDGMTDDAVSGDPSMGGDFGGGAPPPPETTPPPTPSPTRTPCPAGSYFSSSSSICKSCTTLGYGYYRSLEISDETCLHCDAGFTNNALSDGCDSCSVGKYGLPDDPGVCRSCPTNSTSTNSVADSDNSGCTCFAGYQNSLSSESIVTGGVFNLFCKPCPPGRYGSSCSSQCINGQSTKLQEVSTSVSSCYPCNVGSYSEQIYVEWTNGYGIQCKQCEEEHMTTDGEGTHFYGEGQPPCVCAAGYKLGGTACEACPVNTFQSQKGESSCLPCPGGSTSSTAASQCTCDAAGHQMVIAFDKDDGGGGISMSPSKCGCEDGNNYCRWEEGDTGTCSACNGVLVDGIKANMTATFSQKGVPDGSEGPSRGPLAMDATTFIALNADYQATTVDAVYAQHIKAQMRIDFAATGVPDGSGGTTYTAEEFNAMNAETQTAVVDGAYDGGAYDGNVPPSSLNIYKDESAGEHASCGDWSNFQYCVVASEVCSTEALSSLSSQVSSACGGDRRRQLTLTATCEPCAPGTFYESNTESCLNCEAGTYTSSSASSSCIACDADTWSNPGLSSCSPCPDGSSTNGLTQQPFFGCNCASGHGMDADTKPPICVECTTGHFSSSSMQLCEECPFGHAVNIHGASACDACSPGKSQSMIGQTHCVDCGVNKFSADSGAFFCDSCPEGSGWLSSDLTTSSSMYDCQCELGTEVTGNSLDGYTCSSCPAGQSRGGGSGQTCESCPPGKFADSQGQTSCQNCGENHYAALTGNLACTICPEGSTANTYPATSVYQCVCGSGSGNGQEIQQGPPDEYGTHGPYQCGACQPGKYSNSESVNLEIGCATCAENYITPNPGSSSCEFCNSPLIHSYNHTKCVLARPEDVVPFANITLSEQTTEHSLQMHFKDFTHVGSLYCKITDLGSLFAFHQYDGTMFRAQRGEYDVHSSTEFLNRTHSYIKEYGQMTSVASTTDTPTVIFAGLPSFSVFDVSCFLEYLTDDGTTYSNSKVAYSNLMVDDSEGDDLRTLPGYPIIYQDSCNQNASNTAVSLNFAVLPVSGTIYVYALEVSATYDPYADYVNGSIPFPTAAEIKANGVSKFVNPVTNSFEVDFPDHVQETGPLAACVYPYRTYGDGGESFGDYGSDEGYGDEDSYPLLNYEGYYLITIPDLKPLTAYHFLLWSEDDSEPRDFHPEVFELYFNNKETNEHEYQPLFPTISTGCCGFVTLKEGFGSALRATVTSPLLTFELSQHPTHSVQVIASAYYFIQNNNFPCSATGFQNLLATGEGAEYLDVSSTALSSNEFSFTSDRDSSLSASFTATYESTGCLIIGFQYVGTSVYEYGAVTDEDGDKGRGRKLPEDGGIEGGTEGGIISDVSPVIDLTSFTKPDPTLAAFVIESVATPPAAPVLSSATFSPNGDKLIVDFTEATDIGSTKLSQTTLYSSFDCNDALTIQGTDFGATCQFISTTSLQATLPSTSTTVPGSDISVNAEKIYAACLAGVDCSTSTNNEPLVTTVGLPKSPLSPAVAVTGPISISRCGDIRLDASSSFGNGGRAWSSFSWSSTSSASDTFGVTAVVDAANSASSFDPILTIPNSNLEQGQQYQFQLTLTNFLSQTSSLTNFFVVSVADNSVPTVIIEGDSYLYISRSEELTLFASGQAASCGDEVKIIPAAQYLWSNAYSLEQTSADLRYYKVPAFTLTPGQVYTFTVTVTDSDGLTNTATVQVEITLGDLVAKISGGGRSVGATSSVTLNGVSSFDTDYPDRQGSADGFAYAWACLESSPSYGAACTGLSASSGESLTLDSTALNDLLGSSADTITLLFTLQFTSSDSADPRFSEVSTSITIERVDPPEVSITPIYVVKVNPSKKLQIKGSIQQNAGNAVAAKWECEQISDLNTLSSSPTSLVVPASSATTPIPFNLILPSGSLAGAIYVFRLVASFDGVSSSPQGSAQLSIVVNSPPSAGSVSVLNPDGGNTGTALQTEFSIRAQNWVDDASDLPFTYSLLYRVTGATDETTITVDCASAIKDAVFLPVGGGNSSSVMVTAKVTDKYGSFGEASALAIVKPPPAHLGRHGSAHRTAH
ncbi:hypothetical protein TL16_g09685 [Triparma laevis f. inornata]|uniref:Tyrosine-protein kinase ephrin type A/B receptor-like domain-containing protein n=1 Tax=Triparma laevis f. inornata TaxID=1714386 RepID=A0A9W7ELM9_9STRA|nr:hypothetical protein TL16_g09685 [Triparma laevis f. inornata]